MKLLCYYVPPSHLDTVNNALFAAGAGQIGHYSHCCWTTQGQGQYQPLAGSQPYAGKTDQLSQVEEIKVEMVVANAQLPTVIKALQQHHPYETPAYHLIDINT